MKKFIRNNRGDTIVEVIIVLAILGLAMSISYATANRSLLNARQAQENSIATELAQTQIESMRSMACSSANSCAANSSVFQNPGSAFCTYYDSSSGSYKTETISSPNSYPYPGASNCLQDGLYNISVVYDSSSSTFTTKVVWPDVNNEGDDTVSLLYRLYGN